VLSWLKETKRIDWRLIDERQEEKEKKKDGRLSFVRLHDLSTGPCERMYARTYRARGIWPRRVPRRCARIYPSPLLFLCFCAQFSVFLSMTDRNAFRKARALSASSNHTVMNTRVFSCQKMMTCENDENVVRRVTQNTQRTTLSSTSRRRA